MKTEYEGVEFVTDGDAIWIARTGISFGDNPEKAFVICGDQHFEISPDFAALAPCKHCGSKARYQVKIIVDKLFIMVECSSGKEHKGVWLDTPNRTAYHSTLNAARVAWNEANVISLDLNEESKERLKAISELAFQTWKKAQEEMFAGDKGNTLTYKIDFDIDTTPYYPGTLVTGSILAHWRMVADEDELSIADLPKLADCKCGNEHPEWGIFHTSEIGNWIFARCDKCGNKTPCFGANKGGLKNVLDRWAELNAPEKPQPCPNCGSNRIELRVNKALQTLHYKCAECGFCGYSGESELEARAGWKL